MRAEYPNLDQQTYGMSEMMDNSYQQGEPLSRSNGADHSGIVHRKNGVNQGGTAARPLLFSGILPGEYAGICYAARVQEFARGEMLYVEGDSVRQVLLLTSGLVKIARFGRSGTEVVLSLRGPGEVLGVVDQYFAGTHRTAAQASRSCRALVWDALAFKSLAERFPVLHQNMFRILGLYLLELEDRFREMATMNVGPRVACQVVRLLEKMGIPVNGEVELGLSREELAQMSGTTLFTVSRLLSAWGRCGTVRSRRETVTIRNLPSLRAISEGC